MSTLSPTQNVHCAPPETVCAPPLGAVLNGICPYFTMFPLAFPLSILRAGSTSGDRVLDPFCGRGTTNLAASLLGLESVGIDSSPVATAIALAKVAQVTAEQIRDTLVDVLDDVAEPHDVPRGEFWEWAFKPAVLRTLCRLREGLLRDCHTASRQALRAILLGALHGPRTKFRPSYFSNQCTRTFAPKPLYAVRFWRSRSLLPPDVDVADVVLTRARRYYAVGSEAQGGLVIQGDSRDENTFEGAAFHPKFKWVITSPPYYGMNTYVPDQWLRNWFLGGDPFVQYTRSGQISHQSPDSFVRDLAAVWRNVLHVSAHDTILVVRFGSIASRRASAQDLILASLNTAGWRVTQLTSAGAADLGKRQAAYYGRTTNQAREEIDVWAQPLAG